MADPGQSGSAQEGRGSASLRPLGIYTPVDDRHGTDKALRNDLSSASASSLFFHLHLEQFFSMTIEGTQILSTTVRADKLVKGDRLVFPLGRTTDKSVVSRRVLASMDAAKLRAFDAMIWMKERGD